MENIVTHQVATDRFNEILQSTTADTFGTAHGLDIGKGAFRATCHHKESVNCHFSIAIGGSDDHQVKIVSSEEDISYHSLLGGFVILERIENGRFLATYCNDHFKMDCKKFQKLASAFIYGNKMDQKDSDYFKIFASLIPVAKSIVGESIRKFDNLQLGFDPSF